MPLNEAILWVFYSSDLAARQLCNLARKRMIGASLLRLTHHTGEQLGPLRDKTDEPCKRPDHVTKDAQIEALTAEVSELHEQSTKVHDALRTVMATHTREIKEMEATSKRSMASSSLPRRAWRSCATRRLVVPNRCGRRRS